MAAIRTFLKRKVSHNTSNCNPNNTLTATVNTSADSSSDTSSSTTERLNNQRLDGYSSTSTIGIITVHSDDSARRPLLHLRPANRRKNFLSRLIPNQTASIMMNIPSEVAVDDNICLMDRKLPKELILRYF